MPSFSGRASPLPSFTPPRSHGPSAHLLSSAITEKAALSHRRDNVLRRRFNDLFAPLRISLPHPFLGRTLVLPVLKFLHPRDARLRRDGRGGYGVTALVKAVGGTLLVGIIVLSVLVALLRPLFSGKRRLPFSEPDTLILSKDEVERVWLWEIASGRYPSRRKMGVELGEGVGRRGGGGGKVENPGLPKRTEADERREREVQAEVMRRLREQGGAPKGLVETIPTTTGTNVVPVGPQREYLPIRPRPVYKPAAYVDPASPYPPRPVLNSALDLDAVMDHCDFSEAKYVRDCLEVLRMNAGLDVGVRRGDAQSWRTTFVPLSSSLSGESRLALNQRATSTLDRQTGDMTSLLNSTTFSSLLSTRHQLTLSPPPRTYTPHPSHPTADPACDPDYPRIFHIFWAGPFTDKPYSAALSFLYTQRLGLHRPLGTRAGPDTCRPQLWIWINPGPASSRPDPRARQMMLEELASNPWSAPLLHTRFEESIRFKLWNTTEQLDAVSEMEGWREMRLFNSGGVKYGSDAVRSSLFSLLERELMLFGVLQPKSKSGVKVARDEPEADLPEPTLLDESDTSKDRVANRFDANGDLILDDPLANATVVAAPLPSKVKDELFERLGSTSSKDYDRLTVVLSDMARFVLTHRFGGVYLDADTILLRDWEELWGWHGAFAYRWSRLEKYNTAVLKMQRGSAVGNFIFRTAVANGLDFHPMTVSRYTKDAGMEGLLLRLPDALFDPAWLNTFVLFSSSLPHDSLTSRTRSEYYQRDRPPFPYFKQCVLRASALRGTLADLVAVAQVRRLLSDAQGGQRRSHHARLRRLLQRCLQLPLPQLLVRPLSPSLPSS